jgi:meso-butanediol dehydrogenase / (S,S)-butanediol dehydrogenase / diacetyl reductase
LSPKVALVTGGARGIGLAIVQKFSASGFNVMVGDLGSSQSHWNYALASADDLARVKSTTTDTEIAAVDLDVTQESSCKNAIAATLEKFGRLDVLINNAGVVQSGPLEEFSEQDWDQVFAVNSKGLFLMSKAALEPLTASGDAAIVNTASIAGKKGVRNMAAYCGSKFAAVGITQSLAAEFAPRNIRVNAICPGIVGTAMWLEHLLPSNTLNEQDKQTNFEEAVSSMIPLKRPQSAEDMADAAFYLATAKNVTGVALTIAGGMEMN